ncbi:hypothetical protein P22_3425 [Propionispora sp. 2/2-37]|uniref:type I phosphomannose isomerase catalytic subunit n=1 Tax=Propionispora sp. 2/2-37 TaxID=1677858 RepID=UPI0006BB5720|nr:type I phosphomannose isomerase catalytic subunit [Propionispora sp. 2/2-37]CUH97298.1 hypothetical protein P22_3425 [Propionispora sp. 2/2-37]
MYPLKFAPVYKEMIWGGQRLGSLFNRKLPFSKVGESWEICTHRHGMSSIVNGVWQGKTLAEVIARQPQVILGTGYKELAEFPLLIKYLDANDHLSIQVHPDDGYAWNTEHEQGKTEAWYVLHAEQGAQIIYGLRDTVSKEQFSRAIAEGGIEQVVRYVAVRQGDLILVPAGTVHSLLKGVVVCEVQQSSDATYRIHDFNRPGPDGKPRELHIEKALEVIDFGKQPALQFAKESISCPYFTVRKWKVTQKALDHPQGRFLVYCILAGEGRLAGGGVVMPVLPGDTLLLPACLETVELSGELQMLRIQ